MYLRFAVLDPSAPHALAPHGVFRAAYALMDEGRLEPHQLDEFNRLLRWFARHLPIPRDRRIGEESLFWFKATDNPVLRHVWDFVTLLRLCDREVHVIKTAYPGRIVYEDEYQIAADARGQTFREASRQQRVLLRSLQTCC